jgi:hypothetical protein
MLSIAPVLAQDEIDEVGGQLFHQFKEGLKKPCGQRESAVRIGNKLITDYADDKNNEQVVAYIKSKLPLIEKEEKECRAAESLETLFEKFKTLRKEPRGKRAEAIRTGKRIIELYENDPGNSEVIDWVRRQTTQIERDDASCNIPPLESLPKKQRLVRIITQSKEIIAQEGDSSLVLDVMLSMVSSGYELIVNYNDSTFNNDTLSYAKLAIQKIEAGKASQTGNWGVIAPFRTKDHPDGKTNALASMSYIAGYILANFQNQKAEALPYFYKAAQYESDFRKDGRVYQAIGAYYFERVFNQDATETVKRTALAERGLVAYAKAYQSAADKQKKDAIHSALVRLYRFRFSRGANEAAAGLDNYIPQLAALSLPEPDAPLEPVFETPSELKNKPGKKQ